MGAKEYLQKELDFILEKLRFWRYVILITISGIIGIISSKKIETLYIVLIMLWRGFTFCCHKKNIEIYYNN